MRALLASPARLIGVTLFGTVAVVGLLAPLLAPPGSFASAAAPLQPPSATHLMGTDDLGRDVLAGVVQGTRTSLLVAVAVALIAGCIGIVVGALSGYSRHRVDDLLMRGTELVQVVPRFFLAVVVIALWGPGLDRLVLVLGLTSWTWTARVVRAQVLSVREREFVDAARALGASDLRVLGRHVLPNVLPAAAVMIAVCASGAILIEAGLSFIGLGDPAAVSLGELASNAQRFLRSSWWLAVFPGTALATAVLGINLIGDEINDALVARPGAQRVAMGGARRSPWRTPRQGPNTAADPTDTLLASASPRGQDTA